MDDARDEIQASNAYFDDNANLTKEEPLVKFFKSEGQTSQAQDEHHKRVEKRAREYVLGRYKLKSELGSD